MVVRSLRWLVVVLVVSPLVGPSLPALAGEVDARATLKQQVSAEVLGLG